MQGFWGPKGLRSWGCGFDFRGCRAPKVSVLMFEAGFAQGSDNI